MHACASRSVLSIIDRAIIITLVGEVLGDVAYKQIYVVVILIIARECT